MEGDLSIYYSSRSLLVRVFTQAVRDNTEFVDTLVTEMGDAGHSRMQMIAGALWLLTLLGCPVKAVSRRVSTMSSAFHGLLTVPCSTGDTVIGDKHVLPAGFSVKL